MKGIFAWVGFRTATVEYKRDNRKAGKTSFNGWKLWNQKGAHFILLKMSIRISYET